MEQDQENKMDEERLSSEIASAFLERLYKHEVEIRRANNGGHGFLRLHSQELVKPEEPNSLPKLSQHPDQFKQSRAEPSEMYRKLRESGSVFFHNNYSHGFFKNPTKYAINRATTQQ